MLLAVDDCIIRRPALLKLPKHRTSK